MKKNIVIVFAIVSVFSFFVSCAETTKTEKVAEVKKTEKADKCLKGGCLYLPELQCKELLCATGNEPLIERPAHASNGMLYWPIVKESTMYPRKHSLMLVCSGKEYDPDINIEDYLYLFPECNRSIGNVISYMDKDRFVVYVYRTQKHKTYERSMFRPAEL